ncbi:MAG: SpoIIE family protein phosphatase [Candidatus Sericytochromatia bacterium]|nr:SpoIIE family protein phosphatase [Candidatus Sericytochromatia bacterium]
MRRAQDAARRILAARTLAEATRLTRLVAAEQPLLALTLVVEGGRAEGPRLLVGQDDGEPWAPLARLAASPPPGAEGGLMRWAEDPDRLSLLMVRAVGPLPQPSPKAVASRQPARTHTVVAGDTFYRISRQHYGHPGMHAAIRAANRERLGPGQALVSGLVLALPDEPGSTPAPAAAAVPLEGRQRLALRVEVPVEEAPARGPRRGEPWVASAAAALGAAAWWGVGVRWLGRRRRRAEAEAGEAVLGEVVAAALPEPPPWNAEGLVSPWQVELAWAPTGGAGRGVVDWCRLGTQGLGVWSAGCATADVRGLVACGQGRLLWRVLADEGQPPGRTLSQVDDRLRAEGAALGPACYVRFDLKTGEAYYAALGFPGVYALGRGGALARLSGPTAAAPGVLVQGRYALAEGESLLLVPDELLACEGPEGEPYGLERLQRCMRERPGCSASEVVAAAARSLEAFTGLAGPEAAPGLLCVRLAGRFAPAPRG